MQGLGVNASSLLFRYANSFGALEFADQVSLPLPAPFVGPAVVGFAIGLNSAPGGIQYNLSGTFAAAVQLGSGCASCTHIFLLLLHALALPS